ncbi:MAG: proprotein convertase P-domain-containing protein, partial [Verrucomicrobia bacterium]|nr:proprotein convertase P-domain-containing protein [Verrucomicrobiota bacterium]
TYFSRPGQSYELRGQIVDPTQPFRVTLVWTDPPGNPAAAIKLVNDLNLVVSNSVTRQVYYGNNIPVASDYTQPSEPDAPPVTDVVNNVENVFIREPFGSNFVVSVIGHRINVAAVSDYTSVTSTNLDIVQDFALVISTGDLSLTNAFTITPITTNAPPPAPPPTVMTNGVPLLNRHVSAQPTLATNRNGVPEQWNFYVFTNSFMTNTMLSITNGTNVAFITFLPPDLGRPRNLEADIDLYVSKDAGLLKLDSLAMDSAWKSTNRGGTEHITFTNAALGDIFYIGVKAEDQQASEYGLIAYSSDRPFETLDNGSPVLQAFPVPAIIPDGVASSPGGVQMFAIGITPVVAERVVVTSVLAHEDLGDLIGILSHEGSSVVLNNHTLLPGQVSGTNVFVYDDSSFRPLPFTQRTDGPGSLENFVGRNSSGVWMLDMVDNAPTHTGRVASLTIRVRPLFGGNLGAAGPAGLDGTVEPNDRTCFFHDVPPEATNLVVRMSQLTGPVELMIRREKVPDTNEFDKTITINPPGGELQLGIKDEPAPLLAGRYVICVYNPSFSSTVRFHIVSLAELGLTADTSLTLTSTNILTAIDDGRTSTTFDVLADKQVTDVQVGVRINHPRPQDLVLHLVSPQGTRILLTENRGGFSPQGYGAGYDTNISFAIFTEQTNRFKDLLPIKFATAPYTNAMGGGPGIPLFSDGFENAAPGTYSSNAVISGWTVTQGRVQLHATLSTLPGIASASGTNFLELDTTRSPAAVLRTVNTSPGSRYLLSFKYNRNPAAVRPAVAHGLQVYYGPPVDVRSPSKFIPVQGFGWASTDIVFQATSPLTAIELASLTSAGPLVDEVQLFDIVATTNTFVMPEEALSILNGERTIGEWKLEILDTRRGPSAGLPTGLLSWELLLKYGEPRPRAILLTNDVAYSAVLTNNQTNYFIVDLCDTTKEAFATLTGPTNKIVLLADRSGLPTGDLLRDDYSPTTNSVAADATLGTGTFALRADPAHPVPLQPGKRFFLAVHNLKQEETNNYSLVLNLDRDECHGPRRIIPLTNSVPYTNSIPPLTNLFNYYVFTPSCNAGKVEFELNPRNGDLGLVLKKGPLPPLPDLTHFDYSIDLPGNKTNEVITISTNSVPVPMFPGDEWYVGVYQKSTNTVLYTITATEQTVEGAKITGTNVVSLTNSVPLDFTIQYCPEFTNYFRFTITNPVPGVKFVVTNLTSNVDVFASLNALPTPVSFLSSNTTGTNFSAVLTITTNGQQPTLRGDWYVLVMNRLPTHLRFTIQGDEILEIERPGGVRFITPKLTFRDRELCLTWNTVFGYFYQVQGKAAVDDPAWIDAAPQSTGTGETVTYCMSFPGPFRFFRIMETPTTPQPPPPVGQYITPLLRVGQSNLCVRWPSMVLSNYYVQAKSNVDDTTWLRVSPLITTAGQLAEYCLDLPTPYRFFRVEVVGVAPPPPPPVQFITPVLVLNATNLCLRWDSLIGTSYVVEARTNIEDQVWDRISSVMTASNTNSEYCLARPTPYRFFQITVVGATPPPPPTQRIIVGAVASQTNLCVRWSSTVGTNYVVEAKTNLEDQVWSRISSVIAASSTNTEYCVTLPTPYRFVRIAIVTEPSPPPPPVQFVTPQLVVGKTNVCLRWASLAGTNYEVQARTNIEDTAWNRLSSVITATGTNTEYCVELPTPYRFFQVAVVGTTPPLPPPPPAQDVRLKLAVATNDLCLSWNSAVGTNYVVEAKTNVEDNAWARLSSVITATTTNSQYCVTLPTPYRFFRVEVVGAAPHQPPPPSQPVAVKPVATTTNLCLNWNSAVGTNYVVEAKTNVDDTVWARLSSVITATATNSQYCVTLPTSYRFFRVEVVGATPPPPPQPPPPSQPVALKAVATTTNLCLNWNSVAGTNYVVEAKTNVEDTAWARLSSVITATSTNSQYCVTLPAPYRFFRVEVVGGAPPQPPQPPPPSQPVTVKAVATTNNLCLSWNSVAGTNYVVEAKTNVQDAAWNRVSPVITAATTNTEHCVALPTAYQFFRIALAGRVSLSRSSSQTLPGPAAVSSQSGVIEPQVRYSSTNVCLNWDSQVGLKYRIEGSTSGVSRVVYDNTTASSSVRSFFPGNGIEFGDDITLSGTERLLTDFRFDYFLSPKASGNEKAELFFRLNDGPGGTPGTILFRSGEFTLDTSPSGYVIVDGTELGVPVPNALTWSVVITGIDPGEETGLLLNGPPLVGTSIVSFWQKSREGVWTRNLIDEGAVQGSFVASVKAAPTTGSNWSVVSTITATATNSSFCLGLPTPHRLFRIVPETSGPGPAAAPRLQTPVILADGRLQFSWNAEVGRRYELQWSPNIAAPPPANWITLTNVTANSTLVTVTDPAQPTSAPRFYRLRVP